MRFVKMFFRFQKKIWIPLLIILALYVIRGILEPHMENIFQIGFAIIFQIAQVVVWMYVFFGLMGSRIQVKKYKPGDLDLDWDDYRGNPQVVEVAKSLVEYLRGSTDYIVMGGEHEPGTLLEGKPGLGKTWLAKVLAAVAGVPIWVVDCPSLLGTFVGMGYLKVKGLFRGIKNEAIKSGKGAIMFLDEIDSIGGVRGGVMPPQRNYPIFSYGWFQQMPYMGGMGGQILNTILSEMDGINEKISWFYRLRRKLAQWLEYKEGEWFWPDREFPRVMVICSTNRPDILDPALTRQGRMGRHIKIDKPTVEGLKDIALYYLNEHKHPSGVRGISHEEKLTSEIIAKTAAGRTPADVKYILNAAVQLAHRNERGAVSLGDWMEALAEGTMGNKNPLPLSEEERRLLAIHEAGHAIVLLAVAKGRLEPMFVTTERYGRALGHMYPVETLTWYLGATEEMMEAAICMFFAGGASEEIIAGMRHNSMGGDMPAIWSLLRQMAFNGMLGAFPMSPDDKRLDRLIKKHMECLWERTKDIVSLNKAAFDVLVPALVSAKTLERAEVMELIGDLVVPWESTGGIECEKQ